MDDWLKVLLGGVVGSLATMVGAFALELRREDVARAGAARALFLELAQNAQSLRKALEFRTYVPLEDSTWRDARIIIAAAVSPADFATIGNAYANVVGIISAEAATAGGRPTAICRRRSGSTPSRHGRRNPSPASRVAQEIGS